MSLMMDMGMQMMGGGGGGTPSLQTSATAATGAKDIKMGDVASAGTTITIGGVPGMQKAWSMPLMIGAGVVGLVALAFVLTRG